jgi:deoxyribodipyrimidine photo-lyase
MRKDFSSREELSRYLAEQFPDAARRSNSISPIQGGLKAANETLQSIEPARYAFSRNYLDGKVTRLSPYIRHGILSLHRVKVFAFTLVTDRYHAAKFITELAWRDYWQRLYRQWGSGIWEDREELKTGFSESAYRSDLPQDIAEGNTGLACVDAFVGELLATGYLHNHARMWFAAYVVHWRRVRWQAGARFFLSHLLDGDPASNNLSWQWVASTFSHKPYFFNRENLEKYTGGLYCRACSKRGNCDFEGSYESLADKLFRIEVAS